MMRPIQKMIEAGTLRVAYDLYGPDSGAPVVLMHGFPYDVRCYDEVAAALAAAGRLVVVPYLRGYGPTRFLDAATPRSGQQAALGADLLALIDALALERPIVAGYDWGGRAACIIAALWPARVSGLVTITGYNIQDIPRASLPLPPEVEHRFWYQYYLHGERGRAGLATNRADFCRLLWRLWSPTWHFDDATFAASAASFDNPDFIEIVVHSYRHRFGLALGDPDLESIEQRLAEQPAISVPTVNLHGVDDGVDPPSARDHDAKHFTGPYRRVIVPGAGHNLPQETPAAVVEAILSLG